MSNIHFKLRTLWAGTFWLFDTHRQP